MIILDRIPEPVFDPVTWDHRLVECHTEVLASHPEQSERQPEDEAITRFHNEQSNLKNENLESYKSNEFPREVAKLWGN